MDNTTTRIDKSKVMVVYSGSHGCMCGCRGKYKAASAHLDAASRNRGYDYDPSDVSDRSVSIIVGKLMRDPDTVFDAAANCFYLDTPTRTLAAYMVPQS